MKNPLPGWLMSRRLRSGQPDLIKNALWVVLSRFGTQGLAVLFTLVLARRLGSAAFGSYALMAAVIFIGNALTTFGTDMLLIREIASRDDLSLPKGVPLPAPLLPALVLQLILSAGFIALVWVGAPFLPNQSRGSVHGLQIYSLALLPLAFFSVFTTVLRGRQRMDSYMALNLGTAMLQLAAVWGTVRAGSSITWLAEVLLVVQCAGAVLGGLLCTLQIPGFWRAWYFSWRALVDLVRASAPIALIALVAMLYQKLSIYMVGTLMGPAPTGWFSAALRVIEASKTVHLAVFTALYPLMAQGSKTTRHPSDSGPLVRTSAPWQGPFRQSWWLLMGGAVAAALGITIFAGPITQILYGAAYAPAVDGLRALSYILIPFTVNTFFSLALLANHQEPVVLRVQMAGLAALVGLNAWWIPRWGIMGACLAFVAAEAVQSLLYLVFEKITQPALENEAGAEAGVQTAAPEPSREQV